MTREWHAVQGNQIPPEISQRDKDHIAITRNVKKYDEDLYQYEEMIIESEIFEAIKDSFYATEYGKKIDKTEAEMSYIAMMVDIDLPE